MTLLETCMLSYFLAASLVGWRLFTIVRSLEPDPRAPWTYYAGIFVVVLGATLIWPVVIVFHAVDLWLNAKKDPE